jgi:hypothetical protein
MISVWISLPAHAQFQGAEAQMGEFAPMLEQFAPMLEQMAPLIQKMQNRIGKKRMARLVQMAEPLMSMMPSGDAARSASMASRAFLATFVAGMRAGTNETGTFALYKICQRIGGHLPR